MIICEKREEREVKEYVDFALNTAPKMQRKELGIELTPKYAGPSRTGGRPNIHEYAEASQNPEKEKLPRKPPMPRETKSP